MKALGFWERHSLLCNAGQCHGAQLRRVQRGVLCWAWIHFLVSHQAAPPHRVIVGSFEKDYQPVLTSHASREGEE